MSRRVARRCRVLVTGTLALAGLAVLSACGTGSGGSGAGSGAAVPPLGISSPQALMGKAPRALSATLGEPALMRKEDPAQVWQYRGRGCVLDFYVYDGKVTYIDSRSRNGGSAEPGACLRDVHRTRYQGGAPA